MPYRPENAVRSFKDVRSSGETVSCENGRLYTGAATVSGFYKMRIKTELGDLAGCMGHGKAQSMLCLDSIKTHQAGGSNSGTDGSVVGCC